MNFTRITFSNALTGGAPTIIEVGQGAQAEAQTPRRPLLNDPRAENGVQASYTDRSHQPHANLVLDRSDEQTSLYFNSLGVDEFLNYRDHQSLVLFRDVFPRHP